MARPSSLPKLLLLVPAVFLALFYFYPLIQIFKVSFRPEAQWDLTGFAKLFSRPYYLKTLWFSFWQAGLSTALTMLLALPCSYLLARFEFRWRKALTTLIMVPFVLPTMVVATAYDALLGPHGMLNVVLMRMLSLSTPPIDLFQSLGLILLAHVFYNTSVAVRIISSYWSQLPPRMEEAARILGASTYSTFFRITLPLLRPVLFSASLLVFLFCFSSFGVILILGGPRYATVEVEIYRQALHLFNLPMAATLSLVQILFTLILMGVYTRMQRRRPVAMFPEAAATARRRPTSSHEKLFLRGMIGTVLIFFGLPVFALLLSSCLNAGRLSLVFYRALFTNPTESIFFISPAAAMANSIGIAAVTVLLATLLGLCAAVYLARSKGLLTSCMDPIFMLPLSTSAVTLGFGFILALDRPPLDLRTSFWIVPLAHSLVAFPFVVRSVLPALRSIPAVLREAAQILGASPRRAFLSVDLPITARALAAGAVFAFTVSLGEFGATTFVARPQSATIPLAIYRYLGQPGSLNYGQALAMSTLLMGVTAMGFLLLERLRTEAMGEF